MSDPVTPQSGDSRPRRWLGVLGGVLAGLWATFLTIAALAIFVGAIWSRVTGPNSPLWVMSIDDRTFLAQLREAGLSVEDERKIVQLGVAIADRLSDLRDTDRCDLARLSVNAWRSDPGTRPITEASIAAYVPGYVIEECQLAYVMSHMDFQSGLDDSDEHWVEVAYRDDPVNVASVRFQTLENPDEVVWEAWFDEENEYLVIQLEDRFYHYCGVSDFVWHVLTATPFPGEVYEEMLQGEYDCRMGAVPSYDEAVDVGRIRSSEPVRPLTEATGNGAMEHPEFLGAPSYPGRFNTPSPGRYIMPRTRLFRLTVRR